MTAPPIDLSRDACEQRLKNALLEDTNNTDHWDQGVWTVIRSGQASDVMAAIERHEWPCGTSACLAGTIIIQAGFIQPGARDAVLGEYCLMLSDEGQALLLASPWCQRNWIEPQMDFGGLAALLAGLNIDQASRLFYNDNGLRELWDLVCEYTNGRVALPDELEEQVTAIDTRRAEANG